MKLNSEIEGHTIEFRDHNNELSNPWLTKYAYDNFVGVLTNSKQTKYALIDGDRVYKLKHNIDEIITLSIYVKSFDIFMEKFNDFVVEDLGSLNEMKDNLIKLVNIRKNK